VPTVGPLRQAHALQPAATAASVRPFPWLTYSVLCLALAQPAFSVNAQTLAPVNSRDLLTGDAAAFARLLESARPAPVSPEEKARILKSLPEEGDVTDLDPAAMHKLGSVQQVLRTAPRDTVYEVKVIDVAQAAVALHARAVLLISKPALDLLDADELQAVAAHEIGHEYVWVEYDRASKAGDYKRRKELELLCDAIGIVILHQLGMNTSRLMAGVEKISRFNGERFGTALNENAYPTVSQRRQFARAVGEWAAGADRGRSRW
jgi:hypothetical protein